MKFQVLVKFFLRIYFRPPVSNLVFLKVYFVLILFFKGVAKYISRMVFEGGILSWAKKKSGGNPYLKQYNHTVHLS